MYAGYNPRKQGDIGELSAMEWLASRGAHIYVPVGHSPDVDLIADLNGRLLRVEVKTGSFRNGIGRWEVSIATSGGNQSWNRVVKYFDAARCDYLFVHVGDGRRWFIPTEDLEARAGLSLGGPKYAEFEVEPGRPLLTQPSSAALESEEPGEYPSGQRMATVNRPAQPSQVRILPPPSEHAAAADAKPAVGRTRLSSNRQVTIPLRPCRSAALEPGDRFRVEALGPGRIAITRIDEYAQQRLDLAPDSQ